MTRLKKYTDHHNGFFDGPKSIPYKQMDKKNNQLMVI